MVQETRTLMVVDSSATHRLYLGTMLRRLEYAVHSVGSADDALKLMTGIPPSLVISDFALPGMNGLDLLTRMKQDQRLKAVPVIMQGADDSPGMRERCMIAGCMAYFKKPAEIEELYKAIQSGIESAPRQMVRIETDVKVVVGDTKAPRGYVRQESVTELSDGGLYISTLTPEPLKAVVSLILFIEDRVINATAVVLYVSRKPGEKHQGPGMGMKFVTIDDQDRAFIHDYIKQKIAWGLSL